MTPITKALIESSDNLDVIANPRRLGGYPKMYSFAIFIIEETPSGSQRTRELVSSRGMYASAEEAIAAGKALIARIKGEKTQ